MTLLILKLFISVAILYGLYLLYGRKAKTKHRFKSRANLADKSNQPQPSRNLQIKLLGLLNGDRYTANRLIALAKTIDWWVEKVIFDLQRDRGRY